MEFDLIHAPRAAEVIRQAERGRRAVPAPFDYPPKVSEYEEIFMLGFKELSEERATSTEAVLRITGRAVREWLIDYGYGEDDDFSDEFATHIRALDKFWVANEVKLRRKASGKNGRNPPKLREKDEGFRKKRPEANEPD